MSTLIAWLVENFYLIMETEIFILVAGACTFISGYLLYRIVKFVKLKREEKRSASAAKEAKKNKGK